MDSSIRMKKFHLDGKVSSRWKSFIWMKNSNGELLFRQKWTGNFFLDKVVFSLKKWFWGIFWDFEDLRSAPQCFNRPFGMVFVTEDIGFGGSWYFYWSKNLKNEVFRQSCIFVKKYCLLKIDLVSIKCKLWEAGMERGKWERCIIFPDLLRWLGNGWFW